jgi:hypothetical protein
MFTNAHILACDQRYETVKHICTREYRMNVNTVKNYVNIFNLRIKCEYKTTASFHIY